MVFEERYQVLMRECQEETAPFGVLLLRSGREAGDSGAEAHEVGTAAHLRQVEPLGDGRLRVTAVGRERFKVHSFSHDRTYLSAQVEYLIEEGQDTAAPALADRVRQQAEQYAKLVMALQGAWMREVELPQEPAELSYLVAQVFQGRRRLQQRLLEAPTASARLEREAELLTEATRQAEEMLQRRQPGRRFSQN